MNKQQFKEALEARLAKRLETQSFAELTVGGSKMRFAMAMALIEYPFEIPEGADEADYERLMTDRDFDSGKFDDIVDLVFNEAYLKYGIKYKSQPR